MMKEKKKPKDKPFEIDYHSTVEKNTKREFGALFSPVRSKDRLTTYVKVNETDH